MSSVDVAATLADLATMSGPQLREAWLRPCRTPPPNISSELLRLGVAYAVQAKAHGDLPAPAKRALRKASPKAATTAIPPGSQLVRDWNGRTIRVDAVDGGYLWEGRRYRSLSAIATAVTGTRWSGPRFFGVSGDGTR